MPTGGTSPSVRSARWSYAEPAVGYGLPFLLVVYLALSGGGYDPVVYGEVGVICWWVVLLGALIGILPLTRFSRAGWVAFGLLGAFALWTALGISWSPSSERSVAELGRVAAFLGVFALALAVQGRDALQRTVYALAGAIAFVSILALLSRFHPELFPSIEAARFLNDVQARLSYPFDYWNALAAFVGIGIPLVLCVAMSARAAALRAVAAAVLPAMALTAYFTLSRGGSFEIVAGLIAFLALHPRRVYALATVAVAGIASALLILIASGKDALQDGVNTHTAISQGNEMLLLTIVVCGLVAVAQVGIGRAEERDLIPRLQVSRRRLVDAAVVAAAVILVAAFAAGVPGKISDRVDEFTKTEAPDPSAGASRYTSLSGNGRYQLWKQAVEANSTDPLVGIGPGTYEYWWTQHRPIDAYARSAHSLYLNSLAELGIIGLLIIVGVVFWPVAAGIGRWRSEPQSRALLAGALAATIAFAVAAGVDRIWEFGGLVAVFLFLAAALVNPGFGAAASRPDPRLSVPARVGVAIAAVIASILIAIPTAELASIRQSQDEVRAGNLSDALDSARDAADIEPYAAAPDLQRAFILELQGDLDGAAAAAREATTKESTNWRTWLALARIETERGNVRAGLAAFSKARSLNPLSDSINQ